MRCTSQEDEEGREREREEGKQEDVYIDSKKRGAKGRSRKDEAANRTKADRQLKRGRERKAQKRSGEKQPNPGWRPRWQPSALRVCNLHRLLLKKLARTALFSTPHEHHQVPGKQRQSETLQLPPSQLPNYFLSTRKGYLITLAGLTQTLNIGGNSH